MSHHQAETQSSFGGTPFRFIDLTSQGSTDTYADDIARGLAAPQKYIRSKHIYDEDGSRLFEQITQDNNYYPAQAETEILTRFAPEMVTNLAENTALIELGSGSAKKTRLLLQALLGRQGRSSIAPSTFPGITCGKTSSA